METCLELHEEAIPSNVRRIRREVVAAAVEAGASRSRAEEIGLCVGEAVANAIVHGYERQGGRVGVIVRWDEDDLVVIVRDQGRGMSERKKPRAAGGFGMRVIASLAEDLSISSTPGRGTVVEMRFALDVSQAGGREREPAARHPGRAPSGRVSAAPGPTPSRKRPTSARDRRRTSS
jgi:stage II sporulation protein AB (anti-sigma F factor)